MMNTAQTPIVHANSRRTAASVASIIFRRRADARRASTASPRSLAFVSIAPCTAALPRYENLPAED